MRPDTARAARVAASPVQTRPSVLDIFEKMLLIAGAMVGGKNPATITTSAAANKAYSIMSCPDSSRRTRLSTVFNCCKFPMVRLIPLPW